MTESTGKKSLVRCANKLEDHIKINLKQRETRGNLELE
jgi:hypothetical protein